MAVLWLIQSTIVTLMDSWSHNRLRPLASDVRKLLLTTPTTSSKRVAPVFLYQSIDFIKCMRNRLGMVPESLQLAGETGVH